MRTALKQSSSSIVAVWLVLMALSLFDVSAQQTARSFEVASIHESKDDGPFFLSFQPGRLTITNLPLSGIIEYAYRLKRGSYQLPNAPEWTRSTRFTINASYDGPPADSAEQWTMLRHLLEERFGLVAHRETREGQVHVLSVARSDGKLGPRLERVDIDCEKWRSEVSRAIRDGKPVPAVPGNHHPATCLGIGFLGQVISGGAVSMKEFAGALEQAVQTPVVDRTGLSGFFNLDLMFTPTVELTGPSPSGISIFTAVREQLGLKLEAERGPLEVLLIDAIRRPSPN